MAFEGTEPPVGSLPASRHDRSRCERPVGGSASPGSPMSRNCAFRLALEALPRVYLVAEEEVLAQ